MQHNTAAASEYDPFAWSYNKHWGGAFHSQIMTVLDRLLLRHLPPASHIIDLCCGAGHVTRMLMEAGFHVTGIDASFEMLRHARARAPDVTFIQSDARSFRVAEPAAAIVSTFDSFNHVMNPDHLREVFVSAREALLPGGALVFDINREEAYRDLWVQPSSLIEPEVVEVTRGSYDAGTRVAACDVTLFRLAGDWQRSDFTLRQKSHTPQEVEQSLRDAGFVDITHYDATAVGMNGDIAYGRSFYKAQSRA